MSTMYTGTGSMRVSEYDGPNTCDWQKCGAPARSEIRTDVDMHPPYTFTTHFWWRCTEHTPA